jgi:hypothetical protein
LGFENDGYEIKDDEFFKEINFEELVKRNVNFSDSIKRLNLRTNSIQRN